MLFVNFVYICRNCLINNTLGYNTQTRVEHLMVGFLKIFLRNDKRRLSLCLPASYGFPYFTLP